MKYQNRKHAGLILAEKLIEYKDTNAVVLALPNGGIPVGIEIANGIRGEFDLIFISKITPEFNTEVGYGSISESGIIIINRDLLAQFDLSEEEVKKDIEKTKRKIGDRIQNFQLKHRSSVENKTVILVDDGIASGYTMVNAIETIKKSNAGKIIIAVPTAPLSSCRKIEKLVDEIVCPDIRDVYAFAVADAYAQWYDITNDEAIEMLNEKVK